MTNHGPSPVTVCLRCVKQVGGCLVRKQQNWGTNLVLQVPRQTGGTPPPVAPGKLCLPQTDLLVLLLPNGRKGSLHARHDAG